MNKLHQTKQEIEARIIEKATQEPAFRQRLLADPKQAISQFLGTPLPKDIKFTVIEETQGHHILVLPPAPISVEAFPPRCAGIGVGGWRPYPTAGLCSGRFFD